MSETQKPRILLVDDEGENLKALERTLRSHFDVVTCSRPDDALQLLRDQDFAAIVSDQRMPEMKGTELLAKAARLKPATTRMILTAFTETREILEAINHAQIYRYITKPWDNSDLISALRQACERHALLSENERLVEQLKHANQSLEAQVARRTEELLDANQRLSELALTDPLTRVANRRAMFQRFQEEIDRADRYERQISVAMIDVDHFKAFNDMEGHLCGDEALKKIASTLLSNLRKTDFLARYGGEEFLILMPETPVPVAMEIASRLRVGVETTTFQGKTKPAYLTISLGIAGFPKHGRTPTTLIESADEALWAAKAAGRNRAVAAN